MNRFQQAFLAIAASIVAALNRQPVTIDYNNTKTEVTGLKTEGSDAPYFTCRQMEPGGVTKEGGLQRLEVNEHTCNLILPELKWQAGEQNTKAHAAGASGGIGGGQEQRAGVGAGSATGGGTGERI